MGYVGTIGNTNIVVFTQAPGLESGFESGSQSILERWSESGFESSLPPCNRNQSGSGSGSPCKRGLYLHGYCFVVSSKTIGILSPSDI